MSLKRVRSPRLFQSLPVVRHKADLEITDSLAGQMNALKTGGVSGLGASPKRPKKRIATAESSDEESDTEGEAADTSETDTDTDSEDERK